jgi:dihydroorotase
MATQPQQLTITRPDDWHLHLRDGGVLEAVLPHRFERLWLLLARFCQRTQSV